MRALGHVLLHPAPLDLNFMLLESLSKLCAAWSAVCIQQKVQFNALQKVLDRFLLYYQSVDGKEVYKA